MTYSTKFFICLSLLIFPLFAFGDKGHKIKVKVKGYQDTSCHLAFYYGNKKYMADTSRINSNGVCVFEGADTLDRGIYLFVLPGKKYFEFLINNDQHFTLKTKKGALVKNMNIKGSKENKYFFDYLRFVNNYQSNAKQLRRKMRRYRRSNPDSAKAIKNRLQKIDSTIKAYRKNFAQEHKNTMMASIFTAMQDPQVPDEPPAGQPDSNFQYRYYKNHYFDNIDFSDARLLRSPVYHKKLKMYMKQLTAQQPDSVIKAADYVLDKASADKEIFKYSLVYLLNTYSRSKIMGMDKVFVHLVENYYNKGKAYWADSSTLSRLRNRARTLKPTLVGKKAPNIILPDSNKTHHALHELNAKYTILCFWDPGCSHCKDAIPKLDKYYEKVQDKGVVVYAANTQPNTKKWKKFINKHDLNWINVHDPNFNYRFRSVYDIQSTPKIYLLDENKKIIAKQLSVKQLKKLLNRKLNQ